MSKQTLTELAEQCRADMLRSEIRAATGALKSNLTESLTDQEIEDVLGALVKSGHHAGKILDGSCRAVHMSRDVRQIGRANYEVGFSYEPTGERIEVAARYKESLIRFIEIMAADEDTRKFILAGLKDELEGTPYVDDTPTVNVEELLAKL